MQTYPVRLIRMSTRLRRGCQMMSNLKYKNLFSPRIFLLLYSLLGATWFFCIHALFSAQMSPYPPFQIYFYCCIVFCRPFSLSLPCLPLCLERPSDLRYGFACCSGYFFQLVNSWRENLLTRGLCKFGVLQFFQLHVLDIFCLTVRKSFD